MRTVILAAAAFAAFAAPAMADTIKEMTTHGIVMTFGGQDIDVTYTPDGKFSAAGGQVTGTWAVKGEELCTQSNVDPTERCVAFPKDKKSGDSFELTTPQGTVTIKIN
jgi:hypothetical protein